MTDSPRLYVDSCGFIDLVKMARGHKLASTIEEDKRRQKDAEFLKLLCDAARGDDVFLFTSTLTIAECLHVGPSDVPPDQETRDLFVAFLTSGEVVETVAADIFIAEDARQLCWQHGIYLKGADGIHVASAIASQCVEFLTTDQRIANETSRFGQALPAIKGMGMSVIRPSATCHLPASYRTDDLFQG